MEAKDPVARILFEEIEELSFNIPSISNEQKLQISKEKLNVRIDLGFKIDTEKERIGIPLKVRYFFKHDSEETNLLLEHESISWYKIENFTEVVIQEKGGKFTVKEDLMKVVIMPAYSTVRGIIYARVSHTYLKKHLLPLTDTKSLIGAFQTAQLKVKTK